MRSRGSEADERVRDYANGLLARGVAQGRRRSRCSREQPRLGARRFRARADRRGGSPGVRVELLARRRLPARPLGSRGDRLRGRTTSSRRSRPSRTSSRRLKHVLTYHDLDGLAAARPRLRRRAPGCAGRGVGGRRRGRPVHDHLHVGDDRAAEGLHAAPTATTTRWRASSTGCLATTAPTTSCSCTSRSRTTTGGSCCSSAPRSGSPSRSSPTRCASERRSRSVRPTVLPSVPRVYEKIYSRSSRPASTRRPARSEELIDWSLAVGRDVSRLEAEGAAIPAGLRAKHRIADRLVFSKVREPLGGRLRMPGSGGAPLSKEIAEFFDSVGDPHHRGLRPHRVHDRVQRQSSPTATGSDRSDSRCRASRSGLRRTARSRFAPTRSSRATTRTRRRPRPCSTATAGSRPATSASSTRTDSSTSPTARRTSSSPRVARTSRRRTSRTSSRRRSTCHRRSSIGDRRPYVAALLTLDQAEMGGGPQSTTSTATRRRSRPTHGSGGSSRRSSTTRIATARASSR